MRIYISGPVTGVQNFETAFSKAAGRIERHGHQYVNPAMLAKYFPEGSHDFYMSIAFATIIQCDTAYFLRGWENSVGARMERSFAEKHSMRIFEEDKYGESVPELPTRRP